MSTYSIAPPPPEPPPAPVPARSKPIQGARDISRIDVVLAAVRACWEVNPDMRLGQIIVIMASQTDAFYMEDDKLVAELVRTGSTRARLGRTGSKDEGSEG